MPGSDSDRPARSETHHGFARLFSLTNTVRDLFAPLAKETAIPGDLAARYARIAQEHNRWVIHLRWLACLIATILVILSVSVLRYLE